MLTELPHHMQDYLTKEDVPWLSIEEINARFPHITAKEITPVTKHVKPMLSLENMFDLNDLVKFISQIRKKLDLTEETPIEFCIEPKLDGLALSLTYENGKLIEASTRGDGQTGEDVLPMVKCMKSIPQVINFTGSKLVVRGEVFLKRDDFREINAKRLAANLVLYKTPRNTAVGLLKSKQPTEDTEKLSFFAYSVVEMDTAGMTLQTQFESLAFLEQIGLPVNPQRVVCTDKDCLKGIDEIQQLRPNLPYGIDGAVLKVNDFEFQKRLGESSTSPYWARAWKFPSAVGYTYLEDVIWSVGRLGAVTPVAKLTPVTIDGITIEKATLHNLDFIRHLRLQKNSYVTVERAGDVIPSIVGRAFDTRENPVYEEILPPTQCPSCQRELKVESKALWCSGGYECPDQAIQSLAYFCSKDCLDIPLMGIEAVKLFYSLGWIKTIDSVFTLLQRRKEISQLPRWSVKKTSKLLDGILAKTKESHDMVRIVMGLGIPMVGRRTASLICQSFTQSGWESLIHCLENPETLAVGPMTQSAIRVFWSSLENREMVKRLSHFLPLIRDSSNLGSTNTGGLPTSSKVCMSGIIKGLTRDEAKKLVERYGHTVVDNVTKSISTLVIGEKPSEKKLSQARKFNIPIVEWNTFCNKLQ